MSGLVLPPSTKSLGDRVREGDPIVGWRGDPTMQVIANVEEELVQIVALDAQFEPYVACSVDPQADPGWEHTLLCKLRDGDWQRGAATEAVNRMAEEVDRRDAEQAEQREAAAERMAWALERDIGHLVTGSSRRYF